MLLREVLSNLAVGKLSNLGMVDDNGYDPKPEKIPQLVHYINLALKRIYTRFALKQASLTVQMQYELTFYYLLARYAENHYDVDHPVPGGLTPYILDDPEAPFDDDVVKVLRIIRSDGREYDLNDPDSEHPVYLPAPTLFQILDPDPSMTLEVVYQASHPKLHVDELTREIELPENTSLHEALLSYVAYQVYSSMGTQESTAKAQEHMTLFRMACDESEGAGITGEETAPVSAKFDRQGWV